MASSLDASSVLFSVPSTGSGSSFSSGPGGPGDISDLINMETQSNSAFPPFRFISTENLSINAN